MPKKIRGFQLRGAGKPVKKGFVPAEFKTVTFLQFPSLVKANAKAMAEKAGSLKFNDSDAENSSSTWEGETLSAVTKVKVAGKEVDALLDTGASVNLINLSTIYELHRYLKLDKYDGRLETEDGRQMAAVGPARVRRLVGTINGVVNFNARCEPYHYPWASFFEQPQSKLGFQHQTILDWTRRRLHRGFPSRAESPYPRAQRRNQRSQRKTLTQT